MYRYMLFYSNHAYCATGPAHLQMVGTSLDDIGRRSFPMQQGLKNLNILFRQSSFVRGGSRGGGGFEGFVRTPPYFVISLMRLLLFFCYISYEVILFSSLQLTPGGVFISKC